MVDGSRIKFGIEGVCQNFNRDSFFVSFCENVVVAEDEMKNTTVGVLM